MFGTKVKKKSICSYMSSSSSYFSGTDTPSACGGVVYFSIGWKRDDANDKNDRDDKSLLILTILYAYLFEFSLMKLEINRIGCTALTPVPCLICIRHAAPEET